MTLSINFTVLATLETGSGHAMRCLTFANSLRSLGFNVTFSGIVQLPWVLQAIKSSNFTFTAESSKKCDVLIIDSYQETFIRDALRHHSCLLKIQIADPYTPLCNVDSVIWLDPYAPNFNETTFNKPLIAWGTSYMPSRRRDPLSSFIDEAKEVLVMGGASPNSAYVESLVSCLSKPQYLGCNFHIFLDSSRQSRSGSNLNFYEIGSSLDTVAQKCDTVLTAAGTSMWDFLINGRIVGIACLFDNQSNNFRFALENGLALPIAYLSNKSVILEENLYKLLKDKLTRRSLITKSKVYSENDGPYRLALAIQRFVHSRLG